VADKVGIHVQTEHLRRPTQVKHVPTTTEQASAERAELMLFQLPVDVAHTHPVAREAGEDELDVLRSFVYVSMGADADSQFVQSSNALQRQRGGLELEKVGFKVLKTFLPCIAPQAVRTGKNGTACKFCCPPTGRGRQLQGVCTLKHTLQKDLAAICEVRFDAAAVHAETAPSSGMCDVRPHAVAARVHLLHARQIGQEGKHRTDGVLMEGKQDSAPLQPARSSAFPTAGKRA
jgi:hypothetical protein